MLFFYRKLPINIFVHNIFICKPIFYFFFSTFYDKFGTNIV